MFHAGNQNFELKRIILNKLWMIQSFFSTLARLSLSKAAFRFPTSFLSFCPPSHFKTCRIFLLIAIISALWIPCAVHATESDSGSLSVALDETSVPVGGVVWLTLDYSLPQGGRLPENIEVNGLDDLTLIKQITDPGQIRIQLLVDQEGTWQSDPISLSYLDADGQPQRLTDMGCNTV